ncbi:MAG: 50S ribosomal protein L25 [Saprospiraceae bacterium]|jgi:large subunit ribosomal protein L25|nr:50S ribosomal protein L25 [Saprospiraceae bacterium]
MVSVTINGTPRTGRGTSAAKADRNAGFIPCVMYGGGGSESLHFTISPDEVRDLIYTGEFKLANVIIDGKTYRTILKEVQYHPVTDTVSHIDFLNLTDGNTIKVMVPIRFEGSAPGVRAGGKFVQKLRSVKIKTKPEAMVDEMKVDISKLKLGQSLRVRDIVTKEGVEIMNAQALPIATITIPRGLKITDEDE